MIDAAAIAAAHAQYRAEGYAVLRGVFGADEVATLAAAFDRQWQEGMAHGASFRHGNLFYRLGKDAALGKIVRLVQWPSYADPVLEGARRDPRWLPLLEPLIGRDIKQIINQLHWKPPGAAGAEFAFHQDARFRRPRAAYRNLATSYVQTGLAIDAHRAASGGMRVYPGSHRLGEKDLAGKAAVLDQAMADKRLTSTPSTAPAPTPRRMTAASISTAMCERRIATAANGPSATGSRCRWGSPCWCITRICTSGPGRITSRTEGRAPHGTQQNEPGARIRVFRRPLEFHRTSSMN